MFGKISQIFEVNTGVHQGNSNISPLLFNTSLKGIIHKVKNSEVGVRIGIKLNFLAFADDFILIAENKDDLKHLAEILVEEAEYIGLRN